MKKILIFLFLTWMLLTSVSKLAEVQPRQLEPLPTLESKPNYGPDTYITFVHC